VPLRFIQAEDVNNRFTLGREDDLANSQQRNTRGNAEQLGDAPFGDGRIYFFVGIGDFNVVVVFPVSANKDVRASGASTTPANSLAGR